MIEAGDLVVANHSDLRTQLNGRVDKAVDVRRRAACLRAHTGCAAQVSDAREGESSTRIWSRGALPHRPTPAGLPGWGPRGRAKAPLNGLLEFFQAGMRTRNRPRTGR